MRHFASPAFREAYHALPEQVRALADKNYELLKSDPHPSLQLKKAGRFWSVRIGLRYRALAAEVEDGLLWFWIGCHADYDACCNKHVAWMERSRAVRRTRSPD